MATEPFIGDIMLWPINFAPRGWAFCNGQLLPIFQNQALYALLGNTYGGDWRTNFALPDLRGRSIMGVDWESGADLGQRGGSATVPVNALNITPGSGPQVAQADTFSNRSEFIVLNYVIALQGIFPVRE